MIQSGDYDLAFVVTEAGVGCGRCGSGTCAKPHAWRYRKRITDLSTGDVFEQLPILRVQFCDGTTASVMPADVWRGHFTLTSVLETVVHVQRDGTERASAWTSYAGTGESMVSGRSLRRWRDWVGRRLLGSALSWLGPQLDFSWSASEDPASQLERLLEKLTGEILVAFRCVFGYALLDKPQPRAVRARTSPRRVAGRLDPAAPHNPPSSVLPRGTWSSQQRRGPSRAPPKEARRS